MKCKMSKRFIIRFSEKDSELLEKISVQTGLSKAAVFRLGLKIIARNAKPSKTPELQNFFNSVTKG